jgi:hypothetical protein
MPLTRNVITIQLPDEETVLLGGAAFLTPDFEGDWSDALHSIQLERGTIPL